MTKYIDADAVDKIICKKIENTVSCAEHNALFDVKFEIEDLPAADVELNDVWIERANKALMEIKAIRLCDILHGHGACDGCGDDDWVCIALKIEALVANIVGGRGK